jgi:hypothetical protein
MSVRVTAETAKGGAVKFGRHGAWASYAVATVGDRPAPEIMYSGATLKDGRQVQFFLNRETGLIVVDLIDKDESGGRELLRVKVL